LFLRFEKAPEARADMQRSKFPAPRAMPKVQNPHYEDKCETEYEKIKT
jgi:hypothetical protein